jgi:TM2 domain-containing membrane protein YozV
MAERFAIAPERMKENSMEQQPFNQSPTPPSYPPSQPPGQMPPNVSSTKLAAGLCGILLNGFGVHKFILGYTTEGLIMLGATLLTCGFGAVITVPIGIIEGILYLVKPDQEFYETYMLNKKPWF